MHRALVFACKDVIDNHDDINGRQGNSSNVWMDLDQYRCSFVSMTRADVGEKRTRKRMMAMDDDDEAMVLLPRGMCPWRRRYHRC